MRQKRVFSTGSALQSDSLVHVVERTNPEETLRGITQELFQKKDIWKWIWKNPQAIEALCWMQQLRSDFSNAHADLNALTIYYKTCFLANLTVFVYANRWKFLLFDIMWNTVLGISEGILLLKQKAKIVSDVSSVVLLLWKRALQRKIVLLYNLLHN